MLLLEDIDEILRPGANGQALSRLLNQADGILGAGVNMLFVLSSNTSLKEIHPAISRPGRCLAEIEVPKLTITESRGWLKGHSKSHEVTADMSLAELYAVDTNKLPDKEIVVPDRHGQYL
jgi:ATP-dependent 26S proteasome regulatory subunit